MSAKFKLAELNPTAEIEHKFHVTSTLVENELITWEKYHANMKPASGSVNNSYLIDDPRGVDKLIGRMAGDNCKKILDAKYEKADIEKN
eukprot:15366135-Ditylum_brightwellii.AAC.3